MIIPFFHFLTGNVLYAGVSIHDHGYWIGKDAIHHHVVDKPLAQAIVHFLRQEGANYVADFGCGEGSYVEAIYKAGIFCDGFDGNPCTEELTKGAGKTLDLSQPFFLEKVYDWVICLEVGEHIPKEFEDGFFENLDNHVVNGIILSWAIKGQGGWGHFNEQDNEYVKNKMSKLGYVNDTVAENLLREKSTFPWFKNTIMVFRKIGQSSD